MFWGSFGIFGTIVMFWGSFQYFDTVYLLSVFATEVQMVKQMPTIAANQQPTIAIITALYHEKVAVDAMMENKTTYVRYKTEGWWLGIFFYHLLWLLDILVIYKLKD